MTPRPAAAVWAALLGVALVGCAGAEPTPPGTADPTAPVTQEPLVTPTPTGPGEPGTGEPTPPLSSGTTPGATPGSPAAAAAADLADRLGVAVEDVVVVRAESVTWPDGSLGCPRPGMSYTQALVDGSLVVLEMDGARYEYHGGGRRAPFLCENPKPPVGGGETS